MKIQQFTCSECKDKFPIIQKALHNTREVCQRCFNRLKKQVKKNGIK